jgi:hypothetical protein
MKLALPFDEALALATIEKPLPPVLRALTCQGETVRAEIDLEALPTRSIALQLAALAAGTVTLTATFAGYADGVASFAISAHARTLPVHKLLPYLIDPLENALRERGLPEGLLRIARGDTAPLVLVDVQRAIETKTTGMTVTAFRLADAVLSVDATIGAIVLR